MSDGCTGIDALLFLMRSERPPEFVKSCLQHDRDYHEKIKSREQADWDFYVAMVIAAERVADPKRRDNLMRRAKLRYWVARSLAGWIFWVT